MTKYYYVMDVKKECKRNKKRKKGEKKKIEKVDKNEYFVACLADEKIIRNKDIFKFTSMLDAEKEAQRLNRIIKRKKSFKTKPKIFSGYNTIKG